MYGDAVRREARRLLEGGATLSEASRRLGVSRSTLRDWRARPSRPRAGRCSLCDDAPLDRPAYAALLGYYLGDRCISRAARYFALRVSCDASYQQIVADIEQAIHAVRPGARTFRVSAPGAIVVQANWQHWPCLFPQHGPGRKHERPIVLEPWQRRVAEAHPGEFLRGLFHSDGSRVRNWTTQVVAGERKRYDYPRWQFTNVSADIRELCCWALDLVEIPRRQSNAKTISVSTRAGVARLDELIGLKR
ncbi:helix-turn-helix domain-containing protein [Nocardioides speluncae]|uniref:helix-turn-helix domain-containing protein n=1 Tax=Nocardioides speluncae TaxID=2670337 RepID=UPI000D68CE01|nr:helix-turn-helix domain-containing protein [Nocardioides speluncae]